MISMDFVIYAIIGAFAGTMAGALGIGGGVIVVPGLLFIFKHNPAISPLVSMQVAAGTSLAIMVFTSQASLRAHLKLGGVLWSIFMNLWPGLLCGTILGVMLANLVPTYWLTIFFASFLLLVAVKMLLDAQVTRPSRFPSQPIHYCVTFLIGLSSSLLGVGGGLLVVPYLTYCGVDVRKIAAITNVCTLVVALMGSVMFLLTGLSVMAQTRYATGYVYWPAVLGVAIPSMLFAPIGARLSYVVSPKLLRYGFIVLLFVTAIHLLL